jgi:hypothetical protein
MRIGRLVARVGQAGLRGKTASDNLLGGSSLEPRRATEIVIYALNRMLGFRRTKSSASLKQRLGVVRVRSTNQSVHHGVGETRAG